MDASGCGSPERSVDVMNHRISTVSSCALQRSNAFAPTMRPEEVCRNGARNLSSPFRKHRSRRWSRGEQFCDGRHGSIACTSR